jgi:isopentenyl diphosphate isomerase/L-lactate dehydrogenase-like FMN-dependent dehydrogenase
MAVEPSVPFANYQYEIYFQGLADAVPDHPIGWAELEAAASEALESGPRGYLFGGAGRGDTMRANREAFMARRIVPRMLRDVSARSLSRTLLDCELPAPVGLAPIGVQSIVHPDGELASARAAASQGLLYVASTASSHSLEEIAQAGGGAPQWFQLYWPRGDELTASFVSRAEEAGYRALVVTLDTPLLAWRPADLQGAYLPFLRSIGIANYLSDPVFRAALPTPPEEDPQAAVGQFVNVFSNPGMSWRQLRWLQEQTSLPILLKGILSVRDAELAVEHGIDGIIVSNHGGRQVDGAIASLDALEPIAAAVSDRLTVMVDSGIRGGADVVKALALGARGVLVGRPYMWGLAIGGEEGVRRVLRALLAEIDLTLALSGAASVDELSAQTLAAPGPARPR